MPKSLPIPAVRAIARAPQNVTRAVARRTFAPPALAPIAPEGRTLDFASEPRPRARASSTTDEGITHAFSYGHDGHIRGASRTPPSAASTGTSPSSSAPIASIRHLASSVAGTSDFNIWTFNSRVFPRHRRPPVRLGDRVRIRIANLTVTNHPIHCTATICGDLTDGGWVPERAGRRRRWMARSARCRAIEFVANAGRLGLPLPQVTWHGERHGPSSVKKLIGMHERVLSNAISRAAPSSRWPWAPTAWR